VIRALLDRDPASYVSLDNPSGLGSLIGALCQAGAGDAARFLAQRAAADARIDDPDSVFRLLREMRQAGFEDSAKSVARRAATQVKIGTSSRGTGNSVPNEFRLRMLMAELRSAGTEDAAHFLAGRAANAGMFADVFIGEYPDEAAQYRFGRELDGTPAPPWHWQGPTAD
jgi:hypothetical protein